MPHLSRLYEKYRGSGFVLLGVNVDDDTRHAAELAGKLGLKFPVSLDSEKKVSHLYDLSAMPSTVLIDREGRVRYVHRGYRDGYEDTYDQQIRALLKE
jgi:peroxiredoxin